MHRFTPPLLDRLFDDAAGTSADALQRGMSLEQMKSCVARDIEALLNTRIGPQAGTLAAFPLARASVVGFGLQDFVGLSLSNPADRDTTCRAIREAIERHELRLDGVAVSITPTAGLKQYLNFSVTAMLVLDPAVEPVSFDALLQPVTQQYAVSTSKRAAVVHAAAPASTAVAEHG